MTMAMTMIMTIKMTLTTMTSSPMTMPATGLIHKNESGPVNQVILATTQLSADYLIIMSSAAKATSLESKLVKMPLSVSAHISVLNYSVKETVMGA